MNDYSTPNRNQWSSQAGATSSTTAPNAAKYTAPTSFNNYTVPNAKWAPHTMPGGNSPTNPSTLTTAFPSFNGGIPPLYPSISAQSSSSIQGGAPSPFPIPNTSHTPRQGGNGSAGATTTKTFHDKTISASSSTNSLNNLTTGISKLSVAAPYNPYNFNPYDIPTPSATTPNVGGLHSNGATPTGFKFNNFSYSNIATPTTPLNPNVTKMAYPSVPLHHTAAMNNIYAMHNAMVPSLSSVPAQNSFSALPQLSKQLTPKVNTLPNPNPNPNANTKLNSNAAPYRPTTTATPPVAKSKTTKMNSQQLEHQKSAERVPYSYPSYAEAVNKEKPSEKAKNATQEKENEAQAEDEDEEEEDEDAIAKETAESIQKLNPSTWPSSPRYAKFYVIKSFGEDDVHKSIKYNLWCSTERGNRKLDEAFNESKRVNAANIANDANLNGRKSEKQQEIDSRDTVRGCPVYMFFSVNRSGCFCGMAQMISNYYKERHFGSWVQDGKWQGSFIVKWIYVKDIPNKDLKDIQLPNNDNRPVTFSRDTQEIPFAQGIEMLRRFIKYEPKTNILQDFKYYDDRERDIKQKRTQQIILQRMSNNGSTQEQQSAAQSQAQSHQRLIENEYGNGHNHNQYPSYSSYGRGGGGGSGYGYRGGRARGGYANASQNNRRRYYSKHERNGYHHQQQQQQQQSYHHNSYSQGGGGGNYGNYQILKRNHDNKGNSNNSDNGSNQSDRDRSRYNNRAKNRWVPK